MKVAATHRVSEVVKQLIITPHHSSWEIFSNKSVSKSNDETVAPMEADEDNNNNEEEEEENNNNEEEEEDKSASKSNDETVAPHGGGRGKRDSTKRKRPG